MSLLFHAAYGLLALVWIGVVGYPAVRAFRGGVSRAEMAGWCFAGGSLVHAGLYLVLLGVRVEPRATRMLLVEALWVGIAALLWRRGGSSRISVRRPSIRSLATFGVVGVPVAVFALRSLSQPFWTTDYVAIWGLKAKTIFLAGTVPGRLFDDPFLFWSQPDYPLLLPILLASLATLIGSWSEVSLALFYPFCQLLTACVVWGFLRRCCGTIAALTGGLLVSYFFPVYTPSNLGTAEIPLAMGMTFASTALLDALRADTVAIRGRLALASLFCAGLKQEGVLFAVLLGLTLLLNQARAARRLRVLPALCLLGPAVLASVVLRVARGSIPDRDYDWGLLRPERWDALLDRLGQVVIRVLTVEVRSVAIPLVALLIFFAVTRRGRADALLPPLACQLAVYVAACSFSAYDPTWQVGTALTRISATLFPSFALVLASRLEEPAREWSSWRPGVSPPVERAAGDTGGG